MRVLLLQLDGKVPNIALMRVAAHHRERGDQVEFMRAGNTEALEPVFGAPPDAVYASLIFERSRALAERVLHIYPGAIVGGTGWDLTTTLEQHGIRTKLQDYSIYPDFRQSIGFTQRGCRLKCPFCVVPRKEGAVSAENSIAGIWRGEPHPKQVLLLDNDFFGQPAWRERIAELRDGGFKVSFNQGINARFIDEESAEAITSVDYRDDSMVTRRLYTAWDNRKDEARLMRGLELLVKNGARPRHLMVYMLIGYWPGETHEDRDHRRKALRAFGALPYPMPFTRSPELVGFQRWVLGGYDKSIPWEEWSSARYQPRRLKRTQHPTVDLFEATT